MDFIKKLIGGIFGGIFGFLTGLLPGKKKSNGFYLELDEAATGAKPVEAQPAASNGKKAAEPVAAAAPATPTVTAVTAPTAKASNNGTAPKTETTFAPQYVAVSTGSSNGRRLPGANMSSYLDLARQVKTPV